jgi:hypothetical protein
MWYYGNEDRNAWYSSNHSSVTAKEPQVGQDIYIYVCVCVKEEDDSFLFCLLSRLLSEGH